MPQEAENNHPSVHLRLCVCTQLHDRPYVRTTPRVCIYGSAGVMYGCVGGRLLDGLCHTVTGLSDPLPAAVSVAPRKGHLNQSEEHFILSPVISFSWSTKKVKPRACGTHFRPFDNCHLKQQTLNWCQAVRRHALCNEINGCLWKGGSCWHKLSATCFAIKKKKKKQTAFIIMFSHWLKDSYRVMFKPINTQTSCKNRQKNTSKQHSWLYPVTILSSLLTMQSFPRTQKT